MADFDANDVISISARMEIDSIHAIVNNFHVVLVSGGPATFAALSLVVQDYIDAIYAFLTTSLVNNLLPVNIGIRNETQGTVWGAIAWGVWAGGTATGDMLPLGVSLLGFARTTKPRVQIRKYWGVFPEEMVTEGAFLPAPRAAVLSAMNYHITAQTPSGGLTFHGVAYNRTLKTVTYALSATSSEEPAYQRRRKRGRGS